MIIHRYWYGPPTPANVERNTDRWRTVNPDHDVIDWRDDTLPADALTWVDAHDGLSDDVRHRSNLARVWLLAHQGGLWCDGDTWPARPIGPLVDGVAAAMSTRRTGGAPINSVLWAADPGHPWLVAALEAIEATDPGPLLEVSGTHLLARCAEGLDVTLWPAWQTDADPGRHQGRGYIFHAYATATIGAHRRRRL